MKPNKNNDRILAQHIDTAIRDSGRRLDWIAEQAGVDTSTISSWRTGKNRPSLEGWRRMIAVFPSLEPVGHGHGFHRCGRRFDGLAGALPTAGADLIFDKSPPVQATLPTPPAPEPPKRSVAVIAATRRVERAAAELETAAELYDMARRELSASREALDAAIKGDCFTVILTGEKPPVTVPLQPSGGRRRSV